MVVTLKNGTNQTLQLGIYFSILPEEGPEYDEDEYPTILLPGQTKIYDYGTIAPEDGYTRFNVALMSGDSEVVGNSYVISETSAPGYLPLDDTPIVDFWTREITPDDLLFVDKPVNPDPLKTAWVVRDTTLTADLFREGVDKIVAYTGTGSAGGAGPGGSDMENTEYIFTQARGYLDSPTVGQGLLESNPYLVAARLAGEDARDALVEAVGTAVENHDMAGGKSGAIYNTNEGSGEWSLTIPIYSAGGFGTLILDLDPTHYPKVNAYANFAKSMLAWAIVIAFELWVWRHFQEIYFVMMGAKPAKGNTVVGGSGAQITSFLVATAVTALLVSAPVVFWAAVDSNFTWASAVTGGDNPMQNVTDTVISMGIYMVYKCFPVATALSSIATVFLVRKSSILLVTGTFTVIRFLIA